MQYSKREEEILLWKNLKGKENVQDKIDEIESITSTNSKTY
jgi:hypothetical protein